MFALRIAAQGEKADAAKPMKGLGAGVFEIAVRHRGDAYRTVYAVQLDEAGNQACERSARNKFNGRVIAAGAIIAAATTTAIMIATKPM